MDKTSLPPRCLRAIKKTDSEQDKNTVCRVLLISILEKGGRGGGGGGTGWEELVLSGSSAKAAGEAVS